MTKKSRFVFLKFIGYTTVIMSNKQKTIQTQFETKNIAQQISVPRKKSNLLLSMAGVFKGAKNASRDKKRYAY